VPTSTPLNPCIPTTVYAREEGCATQAPRSDDPRIHSPSVRRGPFHVGQPSCPLVLGTVEGPNPFDRRADERLPNGPAAELQAGCCCPKRASAEVSRLVPVSTDARPSRFFAGWSLCLRMRGPAGWSLCLRMRGPAGKKVPLEA